MDIFPVPHISFNTFLLPFLVTFYTFLADCLDIILTHLVFPLHLAA